MTTQAPLRSRWTKAESAYHVRGTDDGGTPTSPLVKIQGCRQSPANPCSAQSWVALVDTPGLCESADMQDFPCMHGPNVLLGQG
jgi:hypothetical protein